MRVIDAAGKALYVRNCAIAEVATGALFRGHRGRKGRQK
jgi:hypothetical protein